jgi:hypothetical protein
MPVPKNQSDFVLVPALPGQRCTECKGEIRMQIFMNTGVCCENCRKKRDGESVEREQ